MYRWVERYGGQSEEEGSVKLSAQSSSLQEAEAEIRRLKHALEQAEQERDILKKAIRIFSRDQP